MTECCNSHMVERSYTDIYQSALNISKSVSQYIAISLESFQVDIMHCSHCSHCIDRYYVILFIQTDWTEALTIVLLTAHLLFLVLFFCSRSLIAPFKQ